MGKEIVPKFMIINRDGSARFCLDMQIGNPPKSTQPSKGDLNLAANIEELMTRPEDWVAMKFRAISAAYLGEYGYFLDFSSPDVLKNSIGLMIPKEKGGQRRTWLKFHRNHLEKIEARIGYIANAEWGEAKGDQTAPGINIDVMIDWKLAADEVRKLTSDPPLLDSVSVSFTAKFEKSHEFDDDWTFWEMLGHEVDGEIVRIIVTEIYDYFHVGLVTEGADEEADRIENDNNKQQIHLHRHNTGGDNVEPIVLTQEQLTTLAIVLGVDRIGTFNELHAAATAQQDGITDLTSRLAKAEVKAKAYDSLLTQKRDTVKALIMKVDGENSIGLQKAVDILEMDDLVDLEKDYLTRLDATFSFTCQECGSTNVERRSSVEGDRADPEKSQKAVDPDDVVDQDEYKTGR